MDCDCVKQDVCAYSDRIIIAVSDILPRDWDKSGREEWDEFEKVVQKYCEFRVAK
jgi:hypothetical protein